MYVCVYIYIYQRGLQPASGCPRMLQKPSIMFNMIIMSINIILLVLALLSLLLLLILCGPACLPVAERCVPASDALGRAATTTTQHARRPQTPALASLNKYVLFWFDKNNAMTKQ